MTEQPGHYSPTTQRDDLKRECHRLIEEIAHRPGYLKLLLGAKDYLAMAAGYKANRTYERKRNG